MQGKLSSARILGTTTFVDNVTDYVHVHLMKDFTLEETLKAKLAYEKLLALSGHTVKAY